MKREERRTKFRFLSPRVLYGATLFFIVLTGCAAMTDAGRDVYAANSLFEERKYSEAVAIYRKVLRDHPRSLWAADARFGLATALAYYDNPQKDYTQALQEFDEFLRLHPYDRRAQEAQNWRQVLKTLDHLSKNIEQLKKLDIRHEEKRKRR